MKKIINFDIKCFMKEAYVRTGIVFVLMVVYVVVYLQIPIITIWQHILGLIVTGFISIGLFLAISIKKNERNMLLNFVKTRL